MKRLIGILLLLSVILCVGACKNPGATPSVTGDATSEGDGSSSQSIVGNWYAASACSVLSFSDLGTVVLFDIYPGYYEYYAMTEGTYAYENGTLTVTVNGTTSENPCTVAQTLILDNVTYQPVSALPSEHVLLSYPDFSELVKDIAVEVPAVTGLNIETDLFLSVPTQLLSDYWEDKDCPEEKLLTGTIAKGDLVLLDYKGFTMQGEEKNYFQGGTAAGQLIVAMDGLGYIDGFGAGLIGHETGTTFTVDVVFPQDYGQASLAGQPAGFEMTVYGILPEIPDAEVPGLTQSRYSTFAEWCEDAIDDAIREDILGLVPGPDLTGLDVSEAAYGYFYQTLSDRFHRSAFSNGLTYDVYLAYYLSVTDDYLVSYCQGIALDYLRSFLIFRSLSVEIPEDDRARYYELMIEDYINGGTNGTRADAEAYFNDTPAEAEAYIVLHFLNEYLFANNTFSAPTT